MATSKDFLARITPLTQGSSYVVTATPNGCDVSLDLADQQWYTAMSKQGLTKKFTFHVALDQADQKLIVTDDSRQVEWRAGADGTSTPVASGQAERTSGRVFEVSARTEFGWATTVHSDRRWTTPSVHRKVAR